MAYCLKGAMTYDEIEAEQYHIVRLCGCHYNTIGVWDMVLTQRGYKWIQLNTPKSRSDVTMLLSSIKSPMVSLTKDHASAIQNGNVYDLGRIRMRAFTIGILVKEKDADKVKSILRKHNIDCEYTPLPIDMVNIRIDHIRPFLRPFYCFGIMLLRKMLSYCERSLLYCERLMLYVIE